MIDTEPFRRLSQTAPQPVAVAAGRVARATTAMETLDAVRRAAEVLTRFVAIAAVSSVATEGDSEGVFAPVSIDEDGKSLAWGYFLDLAKRTRKHPGNHVLRSTLVRGLGLGKRSEQAGLNPLESILEFRNHRSDHSLTPINEQVAEGVLKRERLLENLVASADAFAPLLSLPLVVLGPSRRQGRMTEWNCLHFNGELEPFPLWVPGEFTGEPGVPYLLIGSSLVSLAPALLWEPYRDGEDNTFLFLDRLDQTRCHYRSLSSPASVDRDVGDSSDPLAWLTGDPQPVEEFVVVGGSLGAILREATPSPEPPSTVPIESDPSPDVDDEAPSSRPLEAHEAGTTDGSGRYRRKTLDELRSVAAEHGLDAQFTQLVEASRQAGLLPVPFTHGVMIAPPGKPRYFLVWIKIVGSRHPHLKVSVGADRFEKHLGVDAERVLDVLDPTYRIEPVDSVDPIVDGLRELVARSEVAAAG